MLGIGRGYLLGIMVGIEKNKTSQLYLWFVGLGEISCWGCKVSRPNATRSNGRELEITRSRNAALSWKSYGELNIYTNATSGLPQ